MADPLGDLNPTIDRLMSGGQDLFGAPVAPEPLAIPQMAQPAPAPQKAAGWKELGPLLALLPIAAQKGGRAGVAALLQGLQQGQARQQQLTRQQQQDAALQQDRQMQRQIQIAGLEDRRAQQQQTLQIKQAELASQFADALGKVDANDPAQVSALRDYFVAQGAPIGLRPEVLDARIASVLTPNRRMKAWADKAYRSALAEAKGDIAEAMRRNPVFTPPDGLREMGEDGQPKRYTLGELSRMVTGVEYDPKALAAPAATADDLRKSGLDVQLADARRRAARGEAGAAEEARLIEETIAKADSLRRDPQRVPIQVTVGGSGLTPNQLTVAGQLRDDYRTQSKDYFVVRDAFERVQAAASNPTPAGDLALLYAYMKILDPGSVVRETEFATAAQTGSLPQTIQAAALKVINGQRLTPEQRADFMSRARNLYDKTQKRQGARVAQFKQMATASGVPDHLVVVDELPADADASLPPPPAAASRVFGNSEIGKADPAPKTDVQIGTVKTFPNGKRGRWDGQGWEAIP